jgi:hypothetical protein
VEKILIFNLIATGLSRTTINTIVGLVNAGLDISTIIMILSGALSGFGGVLAVIKKYATKKLLGKLVGL